MTNQLHIEVASAESLSPATYAAIISLCNEAYEEELSSLFATFISPTHVMAYLGDALVSHAMWVTRWLQPGTLPLLRTAYVEMVATAPAYQRQGFGTAVMQRLAAEIQDFDLGGIGHRQPRLLRTPRMGTLARSALYPLRHGRTARTRQLHDVPTPAEDAGPGRNCPPLRRMARRRIVVMPAHFRRT